MLTLAVLAPMGDGTGRIVDAVRDAPFIANAHALALGWPADAMVQLVADEDPATHYASSYAPGAHVIAARPVPAAPPALVAGVAVPWTGLPPGGSVAARDLASNVDAGAVELDGAGALELTLAAGAWRLIVQGPWPWRAATFDVDVAEAA